MTQRPGQGRRWPRSILCGYSTPRSDHGITPDHNDREEHRWDDCDYDRQPLAHDSKLARGRCLDLGRLVQHRGDSPSSVR